MAVLTKALTRLRSDFNARFPGRDTNSDGWIGDYQHQQGKSGHNPDDTTGSKPEYTDADSKAEVRAVDIDHDLRDSGGVTMQQCADALRTNERDRRRLSYIIYNRRIASQSSGWQWQPYSGSNAHTEHLHASGDPDYDEDDAEFTSITQIGDEGMTPEQLDDYLISRYEATEGKPLTVRNYLRAWPLTYLMSQNPAYNVLSLLGEVRAEKPFWAKEATVQLVLTNLNALAQALAQGEGNPDTAAIIHAIEESTATALAAIDAAAADTRDAVADLGEGGAEQVRGPQDTPAISSQ